MELRLTVNLRSIFQSEKQKKLKISARVIGGNISKSLQLNQNH